VVCGLCLLALPSGVQSATLEVPWSQPINFDAWQENGITYARATEFFTALGGTVDLGPYPALATVRLRGHTVYLYDQSPYVRFDTEVFNLSVPVRLRAGDAVMPVATTAELTAEILELEFRWDTEAQLLQFFRGGGEVGPIEGELMRNGMILRIMTGGPVTYEAYQSTDDWLNIIIPGGKKGELRFDRRRYSRYLWEFKSYEFDESLQLSFRLRPQRVRWEHRSAANPNQIEITLIDTTFALDSTDQPGLLTTEVDLTLGLETDPIDVIVVDAGHGGEDLGAVGRRGTHEKDVVLSVALQLAKLIRQDPDLEVILTRRDDTFVPLQERARIANDASADLFISLHANSAPRKAARGFETFFLSAAKTDEARATEQLENASLRFEEADEAPGTDDLDFILTDLLQTQFLVESAALAQVIQTEFARSFRTIDRGVNQAGFVVLYHAYMPAVLVEIGFLSNSSEEQWLAKRSSQKRIAESLYRSIVTFRDRYGRQP
jgi:N-acetylmuramoyl-L-alanine amidase